MKFKRSLLYLLTGCLACLCVVSCSSPKDQYIKEYTHFAEITLAEFEHYNDQQRDMAMQQYVAFRREYKLYEYEFSHEEDALIKGYNRQLNVVITKKYMDNGLREVGGYFEEIHDLIEDVLGK